MPAESQLKPQFHREVDGLLYRTATPSDTEAVWHLLATQFYPRSNICTCLEMKLPQDVEASHALMPSIMKEGVSLVVEDPQTKQLIGARLSSIELVEDGSQKHPVVSDPVLAAKYPKYNTIYRMFDELTGPVDCFKRYGVTRTMAFKFLVVADSHAGRGIAKKLVQFSLEVAKDFNLELVVAFTGSRISERIYENMGFDKLNEVHIPDFVDPVSGGKPFAKLEVEALKNSVLFAKRLY